MPLTSIEELQAFSAEVKAFVNDQLLDFLDAKHTADLNKKLNHPGAASILVPVETFELEIKNQLSNAAHEILQAVMRIEDSKKQNSELDVADYLRYAKTNLEEAAKDIEAANLAWTALNTYSERIEAKSVQLANSARDIVEKLANMLLQTKEFQKNLNENVLMMLNQLVAE